MSKKRTLRRLGVTARWLRQFSSLAVLMLCVRFAWLSATDAIEEVRAEATTTENEVHRGSPLDEMQEQIQRSNTPHRPNLEELQQSLDQGREASSTEVAPEQQRRQRRLLVDLGPARSEVFIQGRRVGRTPYVGQVTCTSGEKLQIQILPPKGVPISRIAVCRGKTIITRR